MSHRGCHLHRSEHTGKTRHIKVLLCGSGGCELEHQNQMGHQDGNQSYGMKTERHGSDL